MGLPDHTDEFTDGLDPSMWRVRGEEWGDAPVYLSYDQAVIRTENVSTRNGNLVITTDWLDEPVDLGDHTRYFSTGYVDTHKRFTQQYGRWEIRAKLPLTQGASRGIWPAIWMLNTGDARGEIDLMESYGAPNDQPSMRDGGWSSTLHEDSWHASGTEQIQAPDTPDPADGSYLGDRFHTWTLEWVPGEMRFLFDGVEYWRVTEAEEPWLGEAFTEEGVDLRLNTQVGMEWAGFVTPETFDEITLPAEYLVDYVRIWEYEPGDQPFARGLRPEQPGLGRAPIPERGRPTDSPG